MSREKRLPDGLTARERIFAELMCKGMRPRDAYRQAGLGPRMTDKQASDAAAIKGKQPAIIGWMAQWLRQARISDIDSPGAAVNDVVHAFHEARDTGNLTAAAALGRLRFQANGIAERTTINLEATVSDADLLRRIAGDDNSKAALLSSMLRPATFQRPLVIEHQADEPVDE